jgi:DHA1 family multidrug resistance protein-like MFS transporter
VGKALSQPTLPWMMLALIGLITFFALLWQLR